MKLFLLYGIAWLQVCLTQATTYYLDSECGNDLADGRSEATAWKTLRHVNREQFGAGDKVLFKRGGLWRGNFRARSGEEGKPLLYGAYGEGPKPIIQNSVARDRESDWLEVSPGIWATLPFHMEIREQRDALSGANWGSSFQEKAKGTFRKLTENGNGNTESFWRVQSVFSGERSNHLQLWGPVITNLQDTFIVRIKMRSSKPFKYLLPLHVMLNHPPWTHYAEGRPLRAENANISTEWKTIDYFFVTEPSRIGEATTLHMNLGGQLPSDSSFDFQLLGVWNMRSTYAQLLRKDVGILILNHGEAWGVKKWKLEDLKKPLDYWYAPEEKRVFVRCDGNPAKQYKSIELAFTQHIIEEGGSHDVIYDGLAIRYGGAHGIGGGNTKRITIRNCDLYWIGGGLQYWHTKGFPVRFGNAIEFWGKADGNLVEKNRVWQVYDAALTNQTSGDPDAHETNIIYRDNVIWQSEYSFEYWNHDPKSFTGNILFEHNTCIDAGFGYAHTQRPDPNGAHLMFYDNSAPTTNFVVRNNIFCRTANRSTRMFNDWRSGLTLQNNLYYIQPDQTLYQYHSKTNGIIYKPSEFAKYQKEMGMDQGSIFAEPQFVDPANRDYRLRPGAVGTTGATDGGPIGARW